jgi:tetratricopeptide (TPR) repeat protein
LPNSSQIPESLAYVARRRGQWDRSESYFNEAERLDPRNVNLLNEHAVSYTLLRRFPEALRKLDQVLNITPDDVDTLTFKAGIAQAEGDLPRASALLASLYPAADQPYELETQVYQAILERRPALITPRLKEILTKPDPALGPINSELRFWLGWAQEVAGDHAAAQASWSQARSELESFLKEQPDNYFLIGYLALTNMGALPIEKDAVTGPIPIEILPGWRRRWESQTAPSSLYRNYSRYRAVAHWLPGRSLLRCSGSIRCSIRSERIRASKNSPPRSRRKNGKAQPGCSTL